MQKKIRLILPVVLLGIALLAGCTQGSPGETKLPAETTPSVPTEPTVLTEPTVPATVPEDGDPRDVTCKGSYTADTDADAPVATVGDAQLTNGQLLAWYWMEVSSYQQGYHEIAPDFSRPLDTQTCPVDDTVRSWQQYFLKRALNSWHTAQALALQGRDEGVPKEEAYQPNEKYHEDVLPGKPATQFLYGYADTYHPNTMHQAYLDNMEQLLEEQALALGYPDAAAMALEAAGCTLEELAEAARLYNLGYMYMTTLSYEITISPEELQAWLEAEQVPVGEELRVDFRHILLVPEGEVDPEGKVSATEEAWEACAVQAEELRKKCDKTHWRRENVFAELANQRSQDPGSALVGGAYVDVAPGQMIPELDSWLFDPQRTEGEITLIRSEYGYHVVYFTGSEDAALIRGETALTARKQAELLTAAREKYPMTVDYSLITLNGAGGLVSREDVLYPDVFHERFPEIPLYLQQDYPLTMYGAYPVATHGCGITSMAMLASYLTDDEQTVPEMCAMFGRYCLETGTDFMLFNNEPATLGFYLRSFTSDAEEAKQALKDGYVVVSLQHKGYWTKGGHFIVIEEITEDDMVRVRDSNLYNYGTLTAHEQDLHGWNTVTPMSRGYWIYQHKVLSIPACARCGGEEALEGLMEQDYFCHKCLEAQLRRDTYLNMYSE